MRNFFKDVQDNVCIIAMASQGKRSFHNFLRMFLILYFFMCCWGWGWGELVFFKEHRQEGPPGCLTGAAAGGRGGGCQAGWGTGEAATSQRKVHGSSCTHGQVGKSFVQSINMFLEIGF